MHLRWAFLFLVLLRRVWCDHCIFRSESSR